MDLNALYQLAEQNQINVFSLHTHHKKAFCIDDNGNKLIALDYEKISTQREEKEIVAEEIAHLQNNFLYYLRDYQNPNFYSNAQKAETRAKRYASTLLIPLDELTAALYQTTNIWELAEMFDTSETMIKTAINNYTAKGWL